MGRHHRLDKNTFAETQALPYDKNMETVGTPLILEEDETSETEKNKIIWNKIIHPATPIPTHTFVLFVLLFLA